MARKYRVPRLVRGALDRLALHPPFAALIDEAPALAGEIAQACAFIGPGPRCPYTGTQLIEEIVEATLASYFVQLPHSPDHAQRTLLATCSRVLDVVAEQGDQRWDPINDGPLPSWLVRHPYATLRARRYSEPRPPLAPFMRALRDRITAFPEAA